MAIAVKYSHIYRGEVVIGTLGELSGLNELKECKKLIGLGLAICDGTSSLPFCFRRVGYQEVTINGTDKKLYVSSESKLPRDLLRNSGYSIVRNPLSADKIVIPAIVKIRRFYCNLCVSGKDDSIYLINVTFSPGNHDNLQGRDIVKEVSDFVTKKIVDNVAYISCNGWGTNIGDNFVHFVPYCEEYENLVLDKLAPYNCVYDYSIETSAPMEINPENLTIWSKINEGKIFEKILLQTDYKKYPYTLATLIKENPMITYSLLSPSTRNFLQQAGVQMFYENEWYGNVTPDDWNMCQDWLMYRLGLDDKGGFINQDKVRDIRCNRALRKMFYVRPLKIKQTVNLRDIREKING